MAFAVKEDDDQQKLRIMIPNSAEERELSFP